MSKKQNKKVDKTVIAKIMNRAVQIHQGCKEECRDFRIMISPKRAGTLILRWTTIDMRNLDNPRQCYHYECFNADGTSQNCSINYSSQTEANEFFFSLTTLYKQKFANDHKVASYV